MDPQKNFPSKFHIKESVDTAMFVEGFRGYSDEFVTAWWEAVQDLPAPRCAVPLTGAMTRRELQ